MPAGHVEVVRLLLSKGVPVDPIERRGTPLHLAAVTDNHQSLKLLLDHGADVSCRVSLRCYPVALAICWHTIHIRKALYLLDLWFVLAVYNTQLIVDHWQFGA